MIWEEAHLRVDKMKVTSLRTKFGRVDVCEEGAKARGIVLTNDTEHPGDETETKLSKNLLKYFQGERVDFSGYDVDLSSYTPFEVKVLQATRRIPYGAVKSYKEIAEEIGNPRAYRAVAYTLSKNRSCVVIPCHRVLGSGGSLGGFSAGIEWKVNLLKLEGVLKDPDYLRA
ncbi:MAG: methylated-DNA--[protein]-cysteine S-methyltransferase [Thermoplasmata archaeon]